jgi:kynurenine formamidase
MAAFAGPDARCDPAAARTRDIRGFGTETVGTDAGQGRITPPYPAHYLLHGAGRYGLQCLANLDRLPPTGAMLIAPPLKIKGGTGSPLRVLALVDPAQVLEKHDRLHRRSSPAHPRASAPIWPRAA